MVVTVFMKSYFEYFCVLACDVMDKPPSTQVSKTQVRSDRSGFPVVPPNARTNTQTRQISPNLTEVETHDIIYASSGHVIHRRSVCNLSTYVDAGSVSGYYYDYPHLVATNPGSATYNDNMNCYWYLSASGATIVLVFTSFRTESSYDYFRVYSGTSTSGTQLLSANGSSLPNPVIAPNAMTIHFHTDSSVTYSGITASALIGAVCFGTTTVPSGFPLAVVTNPGQSTYNNNMNCNWALSSTGNQITLTFSAFMTNPADYLRVYCGTSTTATTSILTRSGTSLPTAVTCNEYMYITFRSSASSSTSSGIRAIANTTIITPDPGTTPGPAGGSGSSPSFYEKIATFFTTLSIGAMIGFGVAALVLICIFCTLCCRYCKKRRNRNIRNDPRPGPPPAIPLQPIVRPAQIPIPAPPPNVPPPPAYSV